MKSKYSQQTDTLYIELSESEINETRDPDEDIIAELDAEGRICALTIEHASIRADIPYFSFEQVVA